MCKQKVMEKKRKLKIVHLTKFSYKGKRKVSPLQRKKNYIWTSLKIFLKD